jgi:hypothetical protein
MWKSCTGTSDDTFKLPSLPKPVNYFMTDESNHVFFSHFYSHITHIYFVFAHTHAHHPVAVSLTPWPLAQLHIHSSTLAGE